MKSGVFVLFSFRLNQVCESLHCVSTDIKVVFMSAAGMRNVLKLLCCTFTVSLGIFWLLASRSGHSISTQRTQQAHDSTDEPEEDPGVITYCLG